jgi:hypothetical protein
VIIGVVLVAAGCGQTRLLSDSGRSLSTSTPDRPVPWNGSVTRPACRDLWKGEAAIGGSTRMTLVTNAAGVARADRIIVGTYHVVMLPAAGFWGVPVPMRAVVYLGRTTKVTASYDTGIR